MQGASSSEGTNHSHTHGTAFGSNLGFSVSPKEMLTCEPEETVMEPPIFGLVDNLLYLLNHTTGGISIVVVHINIMCRKEGNDVNQLDGMNLPRIHGSHEIFIT